MTRPTKRESQVLEHLTNGMTSKEIAHRLYISKHTVESHKKSLIHKLKVDNTVQLVVKAVRMGMVCVAIMCSSLSYGQMTQVDKDLFFTNLDIINNATSWQQTSVDITGDLMVEYEDLTFEEWEDIYTEYFSTRYFSANLQFYIQHRTFWWNSEKVRENNQYGLFAGLQVLSDRLLDSTPNDAALSDSLLNNALFTYSLGQVNFHFHRHLPMPGEFYVVPELQDSVYQYSIDLVNRLPHFLQIDEVIDHTLYPHLHRLKDQLLTSLSSYVRINATKKTEISNVIDIQNASSTIDSIWQDHSTLIIDNGQNTSNWSAANLSAIKTYLDKVPTSIHDMASIALNNELGASGSGSPDSGSYWNRRGIWSRDIASTVDWVYPEQSKRPRANYFMTDFSWESGATMHDHIYHVDQLYRDYIDTLLSRAEGLTANFAYDASERADDYYNGNPDRFTLNHNRMYMANSEEFLNLAIERWQDGNPHPMSQLMLFANVYSIDADSTTFYDILLDGTTTCQKIEVVKDGDGYITQMVLPDGCTVDLTLDAEKQVTDLILSQECSVTAPDCAALCNDTAAYPDFCALIDFYHYTDGPNWTNNAGWVDGYSGTDCDYCNWFGVTCDDDNRVVEIDLSLNLLAGKMPESISGLSELTKLELDNNSLYDTIPDGLYTLDKLVRLNLYNNNFKDSLSHNIVQLSNLEFLDIAANQLNGSLPKELGQLSELYFLNLGENDLSGILPVEIGNLKKMQWILLGDNELSGVIPLDWAGLDLLWELWLYNNNIGGEIPEIFEGKNLATLRLQSNNFIGSLPVTIAQSSSLNTLLLYDNDLSGCIPIQYSVFCSRLTSNALVVKIDENPLLNDGNNLTDFCNDYTDVCSDVVLLYPQEVDILDNGCTNNQNDIHWTFKWFDGSFGEKVHLQIRNTRTNTILWQDSDMAPDGVESIVINSHISDQDIDHISWRMRSYLLGTWEPWTDYVTLNIESVNTDCTGCTDPYSHEYSAYYIEDDGSCATCSDNIMNGDEEGVDCGGTLCYPCEPDMCNTLTVFGAHTRMTFDIDDLSKMKLDDPSVENVNILAYDTLNRRVFYIDRNVDQVGAGSMDAWESGHVIFRSDGIDRDFVTMVYNPVIDHILVADQANNEILAISPDGSSHYVFAQTDIYSQTKLVVNDTTGEVYWNDRYLRIIIKADPYGSCIDTWVNTIHSVYTFDIDFNNNKLFFAYYYDGILRSIDLNTNTLSVIYDYPDYLNDIEMADQGDLILYLNYPRYEVVRVNSMGAITQVYQQQVYSINNMSYLGGILYLPYISEGYNVYELGGSIYHRLLPFYSFVYDMWSDGDKFYYVNRNEIYSYAPQSDQSSTLETDEYGMRQVEYDDSEGASFGLGFNHRIYKIDANWDTTYVTGVDNGFIYSWAVDTLSDYIFYVVEDYTQSTTQIVKSDYQGNESVIWSRNYAGTTNLAIDISSQRLFVIETWVGDYALNAIDYSGNLLQALGDTRAGIQNWVHGGSYDPITNKLYLSYYSLLYELDLTSLQKTLLAHDPRLYGGEIFIHRPKTCDPCYNGIMDGGESGIDCGGSCKPCDECDNLTEMVHGEILDNTDIQAERWLMSDGYVMPGSDISLQAGTEITLMHGAEVGAGATASFTIDPCDPPGSNSTMAYSNRATKQKNSSHAKFPMKETTPNRYQAQIHQLQMAINKTIQREAGTEEIEVLQRVIDELSNH